MSPWRKVPPCLLPLSTSSIGQYQQIDRCIHKQGDILNFIGRAWVSPCNVLMSTGKIYTPVGRCRVGQSQMSWVTINLVWVGLTGMADFNCQYDMREQSYTHLQRGEYSRAAHVSVPEEMQLQVSVHAAASGANLFGAHWLLLAQSTSRKELKQQRSSLSQLASCRKSDI